MALTFDLREVPFSRRGSYLAVSRVGTGEGELCLRTVRGGVARREVFSIRLTRDGHPVHFRETAAPDAVTLEAEGVRAVLVFDGPCRFRFRVEGGGLRLAVVSVRDGWKTVYALPDAGGRWQVNASPQWSRYMLVPLRGTLAMDAPWARSAPERVVADFLPEGGVAEGAVDEWFSTWKPGPATSMEAARSAVAAEFAAWLAGTLPVPDEFAAARAHMAYVNWSCIVNPSGHLRRPAALMSKNWMTNVWSWDHCFNAMSLAAQDPDLAWDQFMVMFDAQDGNGTIPDSINDREVMWNWCKPPIHGWTLLELMKQPALSDPDRLNAVYGPLAAWTKWWIANRDADGDGACDYQHGNDSGWDNATVFDGGCPVEGADLTAFLAIQAAALAEVAGRLGRRDDRAEWNARADRFMDVLIGHHWRDGRFISPRSGDHAVAAGDSLMGFLPLVLGPRLAPQVRRALVAGLTVPDRFVTEWGCATESPKSRFYQPDGYWRGPIWAPPMMIICDGLEKAGETALARDLTLRFCRAGAKSGAAENFDALTGAGLCDRAYTWTASVFLLLANRLLAR
jgi:glycogen debranching enzyme